MDSLKGMAIFATVVDKGSMAAAAQSLGMTPSAVSQQIRKLESRAQVTLLHRTTRRLTLTEAGEAFGIRSCAQMLAIAEEAERRLGEWRDAPVGELRLAAPVGFSGTLITQALKPLLENHRQLRLQLFSRARHRSGRRAHRPGNTRRQSRRLQPGGAPPRRLEQRALRGAGLFAPTGAHQPSGAVDRGRLDFPEHLEPPQPPDAQRAGRGSLQTAPGATGGRQRDARGASVHPRRTRRVLPAAAGGARRAERRAPATAIARSGGFPGSASMR